MSVAGISSTGAFQQDFAQVNFQKAKSDFAQVGQDLQSGNLSQAQADFATLQKDLPQNGQNTSNKIGQDFSSLSQALQSGNLSSAQQAFSTVQTDLQSASQAHHHHHHHGGGSQQNAASSAASQDFTQLGQDLQSGDLASAQKAFSTLQSDLQKYKDNSGSFLQSGSSSTTTTANATGSTISVNG
jgi:hypothetical protein